jgi:methylated-DNA-protein-cysteine methyltransferase related protein
MPQNDFFDNVYEVVKLVPLGRVTTYGAIAAYLGSKRGARMVGWAMNNCHARPDVPAHRVVNRNGVLTGKHFFGSPTAMQELLATEGVQVSSDEIIRFSEKFWDPSVELL